ncbi:hypothetical protein C8R45DRAFT_1014146 [Mycena sanguinolenta]|nr:hypothetical protein C8R45DRAFT_1014146 [Mycena sanguinolenta]
MAQPSHLAPHSKRGFFGLWNPFRRGGIEDLVSAVDSSVRSPANSLDADRPVPADNNNALVIGSQSDRPHQQTTQRSMTIDGIGNTVTYSYIGGHNVNMVNNVYYGDDDLDLEVLRPLIEKQPNLLRIICVAIACCIPPSVMRISRILGLAGEEVQQAIDALKKHLQKPVVSDDNITFPKDFVFKMYRSCLQIVGGAHADITCWCLKDAIFEPQDTQYAMSNWAWHLSQATPSLELKAVLESFPFVLDTVTQFQLYNAIHWLKRFSDLLDAAHLVAQYQDRLTSLAEKPPSER